jgi:hypothetical protein
MAAPAAAASADSAAPAGPGPAAGPAGADSRKAKPGKGMPETISAEEFKNDPLIQKALELFKGQIVEVQS